MFSLPVNIEHSSIGKLSLTIPWRSLLSSPTDISLEDVYLLVTPKEEKDWKFIDYDDFKNKSSQIEAYAQECLQNFVEIQKAKVKGE